jgi:hypothetical protein
MKQLRKWPVPEGRENPFTEEVHEISEASATSAMDLFELIGLYIRHAEGKTVTMKVTVKQDGFDLRIRGTAYEEMTEPEGRVYNAIDFPEAAFHWKPGEVRKFIATDRGLFYELDNPEGLPLPGIQIDWDERREMDEAYFDKS